MNRCQRQRPYPQALGIERGLSDPINRRQGREHAAQAKIYVSMLRAGHPCVRRRRLGVRNCMSQRMLNVSNVKVMVPLTVAASEIAPVDVDVDELTQRALSAVDNPRAEREG